MASRRRIERAIWLRPVLAWLALLILLGLTVTVSLMPMGNLNLPISLCIAGVKASIIGFIFMRLIESSPLQWLTAMAGPVWIFIMFVLMASDYLTR